MSWQLLFFVVLLPLIGGVLAATLLIYVLYFLFARKGGFSAFFSRKVIVWCVLAVLCNAWTGVVVFKVLQFKQESLLKQHYRESRRRFVLAEDFQYGDLLIPKGSLINRDDVFDNGEPQRPLGLRGLDAVRFPHPILIAGVWVTAFEANSSRLELAREQRLGPAYSYDAEKEAWLPDPSGALVDCKQGESAIFNVPIIDYDIEAEFLIGEPDGAEARFKPSQWQFERCERDGPAIEVKPVYAEPAPSGAETTKVFLAPAPLRHPATD